MTETQVYDFSMRPWRSSAKKSFHRTKCSLEADAFPQTLWGCRLPWNVCLPLKMFAETADCARDWESAAGPCLMDMNGHAPDGRLNFTSLPLLPIKNQILSLSPFPECWVSVFVSLGPASSDWGPSPRHSSFSGMWPSEALWNQSQSQVRQKPYRK
jgi:hypothetical protein